MEIYRAKFKDLYRKGLFDIFGTNVINYIINFLTNIFIVRFLTKKEYGVFTYSNNDVAFFLLLSGMGLISGLLQFCSEKRPDKEKAQLLKAGFIIGFLFNVCLSIGILIYSVYGRFKISGTDTYVRQLMFLPVFIFTFDYISIFFRINRENKKYSRVLNVNTVTYFCFASMGAYFNGISGTITGRYIAYAVSVIYALYLYRENITGIMSAGRINTRLLGILLKYSFICCLSNSISQLLYLLDIRLVGEFTVNEEIIAAYKAATLIPTALSFIPSGIMIFIYPYFAERNTDYIWIKEKVKTLLKYLTLLNLLITVVLFFGAPLIVAVVFHNKYADSVITFRILALNFFLMSTFRIPCGNILAMMRKVNVNLVVSIISGAANIILDIILIKAYGSNGAAIATAIVVLISSIISFWYLRSFLRKKIYGK